MLMLIVQMDSVQIYAAKSSIHQSSLGIQYIYESLEIKGTDTVC